MLSWFGLRSRLVLVVLLALLPIFGLFAYSVAQNQQAAVSQAQVHLQTQALLAAVHQQRLVERVAQLLGDMASNPPSKERRHPLCSQYLKNLLSQDADYINLGVVGLDGKIACLATSTSIGLNLDVSDRPFFKQALATQKFSVGQYGLGRISGREGITFSMPVYSGAGVFNGVAFAVLEIPVVDAALNTGKVLAGAYVRVMDRRGVVLAAYPATANLPGPGMQEKDGVVREAALARQPGGRESVDVSGVEQVYAYAPVGGLANGELFVAISAPRDVITAASRELLRDELVILLALTAFGAACAWAMGKRLVVNPAQAILKEADEITRGNLQARTQLGLFHQGELGQLGLAFNRMAESLQTQRSELDAALRHADGERAMLDLILNSLSEGVIAVDAGGRFLLFNATAGKLFSTPGANASFEDWRQDNPLYTLAAEPITPTGPLAQTLRGASIDNWDLVFPRPGVQDRILRVSARPLLSPDRRQVGALMVFVDVTELKAAESFALAQEKVLVLIAGGAPVQQSLEAVVRLIEKSSAGSFCSILMVAGGCLRHGVAPSLPQALVQAIDALPIAEGVGACGTAAFRKESVVIENIAHDPLARDYRELLGAHGLQACWSTPVLAADGEVLATFAIYRQAPGCPQPVDLALIATATRLAGLVLEGARARKDLITSEARFRELAENIEDVFYSVDAHHGGVRYISPGYEKIWGLSCESLYADPDSYGNTVLPEDRHALARANALNDAGQTSNVEYRILSADGQTRWIRDRSYPVFSAVGKLERVVGIARDITESKRAALALASTHRALQMLSRSSIAINRVHDEDGLLAEVCRVAVEAGGYRMAWVGYAQDDEEKSILPVAYAGEELGYLSSIKLYWSADHPGGQGPAGQAIRTGQPQQSADISRGDNHFHWHEAAMERGYRSTLILPLCNERHSFGVLCLYAGQVQQFAPEEIQLLQELADNLAFGIVSLRARLERRRSQEAARQASAKLREQASLIDLAPDAIVVRNLDRTVRLWNKGAERLYGWSAEEVIGKTMEELMYPNPEVLIAAIDQVVNAEGDWHGEMKQIACDGSVVYVERRSTVMRDEYGQINGVMAVNTDIRERKQAREEILQLNASLEDRVEQRTAQLKFANQQLEAFSYSVSHDLRSPLSSINGFSNLLEKTLIRADGAPLTERSRHYLARIRAGAAQMGELIDAMLSLAQVSRSSLSWETVDLSALAEALLLAFQEREPDRVAQVDIQAGLLAQGDPRLLRQVLDNLLGNAWKFTARQSRTRITLGSEQGSAGETVYFVRDNGAGFDMAYIEKLFGAFQRLHTEAEFAGTGIGLATVQRIILRHGGRAWAKSALNQGATFYFTLGAVAA